MAYVPLIWKNREVERPRTFQLQNNADGSVTLVPKEGVIVEAGTPIIADNMNRIEQGIADISMAVGSGVADYVRQPGYSVTSGTATAYTVILNPVPTILTDGFGITIVPHVTNGVNPTLNINALGAFPLKDQKGIAFATGKLLVGKPYTFRKVGLDFLADSAGGSGNATAGDIRAGKTAATDAGDITGTLPVQTGGTVTPGATAVVKPAGIYDTPITVPAVDVPAANVKAGTTIAGTAGTMPNRTGVIGSNGVANWANLDLAVYIPEGYYPGQVGNGEIRIPLAQLQAVESNLIPGNVRENVNIRGIVGNLKERMSGTIDFDYTSGGNSAGYTVDIFTVPAGIRYFSAFSNDAIFSIAGLSGSSSSIAALCLVDSNGMEVGFTQTISGSSTYPTYTLFLDVPTRQFKISGLGTVSIPGNFNLNGPIRFRFKIIQHQQAFSVVFRMNEGKVLYSN